MISMLVSGLLHWFRERELIQILGVFHNSYRETGPTVLVKNWSVRGHSISAWTRWGGMGQKMSVFVHSQGIKTVQTGSVGQKMAKFSPRSCWMPQNTCLKWLWSCTKLLLIYQTKRLKFMSSEHRCFNFKAWISWSKN